ncbi:MAG TPA: lysylphosphatidylglycerol synthase transmembrane domain-containing protein [Bacteroidales bacterium]|nr:lysylphosphatidylglycerol synthase transmembrane domain-containing protein [Bacteroidales bacterium]
MKKGLLQAVKILAFIALGLLLLWLAFRQTNFRKLAEDLRNANYSWMIVSLLFGFFAFLGRSRRWVLLIRSIGFRPSLSNTYHAVMTGYLANLALPRLGELTRCVALGKKEKIPVDQLVGTVIIERAFDMLVLFLIMFIVLITSSRQIGELIDESILTPLQNKFVLLFGVTWIFWVVTAMFIAITFWLIIRYRKNLRKIKIFGKMFDIAKGVINGLKSITNLERKGEFILQTAIIWISYTMMTWVVAFSIPSTSHLSFIEAIFLLVIGGLAMSAPVQGGFGVFHYAISRALIILEGVSMEDGLAYAVLAHESQLIWIAVTGTISFFIIFRKSKKERELVD